MTSITSLYLILTAVVLISLMITLITLLNIILRVKRLHKFRKWYHKKSIYRYLLYFIVLFILYILTLLIHSTAQTPSTADGVSQDAINIFETTMLIYRTIFMYTVVTPLFLLTIYHLYKVIFILVRVNKQKDVTEEIQLLRAISNGMSNEICEKYKLYINKKNVSLTPFSYEDDTLILKCLDKNHCYELSTKHANIIEKKQKHKQYTRKINKMYLGDIV